MEGGIAATEATERPRIATAEIRGGFGASKDRPVSHFADQLVLYVLLPRLGIFFAKLYKLPIIYARNMLTTMSQNERNIKVDTKTNMHNTPNTAMATVSRASSGKTPEPR